MSERPAPLTITAESRASSLEVRGPVSRSIGRAGSSRLGTPAGTVARPSGAGLTLRERRVKTILLKELETLGEKGKTWISYQERKHLFETLDVAFIDREIAKMKQQLRPKPRLIALGVAACVLYAGLQIAQAVADPFSWFAVLQVALGLLLPASMAFGFVAGRRATRRRLWIYQALRELSDAEDLDIQLPESVALADLLIDRIVEAEDEASRVPLQRVRA